MQEALTVKRTQMAVCVHSCLSLIHGKVQVAVLGPGSNINDGGRVGIVLSNDQQRPKARY